jgi:hypothetical protein
MANIRLSPIEKETIIIFNEGESRAECFTYNRKLTSRLKKLCESHGDEIKHIRDNGVGGLTFAFPKAWVRVNPKRRVSDKQRAAAARNLARAAEASPDI